MSKLLALALSLVLAVPITGAAQQSTLPDSTSAKIDRVFIAYRDTTGPGCAVGVGREGKTVFERGYGMANLETGTPIRPASIFHVASVSKQFTAAAIMLLVRDGKLSVDDDIRKYVPEVPSYGKTITVRHLLNHTSGLRDQWDLLSIARGRFEEERITEADVLDIVARQKALNFPPGTEYVYSNTGYTLLGTIVKRVSGQSLRDFVDARIFKPLGMSNTHFHDDYTMIVPGRTSAYARRGAGWRVSIPNFDTYGATSLFTTVGDLLKWEANLDKPVVGDRAMVDLMETRGLLASGDTISYGYGLTMGQYRGARFVEHSGGDAGYRSFVGRFPEHDLAVAIACNASTANTTALARGVADAVLGTRLSALVSAEPIVAVPVPAAALARRVGTYIQPTTLQVIELALREDGRLMIGRESGQVLTPLAENRFRLGGQAGELVFADGERAGFERRAVGGGGRPVPFAWHAPVTANAKMLAPYAGEYFSEELNATYRIAANDSTLMIRTRTSNALVARMVSADTFLAGNYTIQFQRKGGKPSGFEVTNGRMRRVRFERLAK